MAVNYYRTVIDCAFVLSSSTFVDHIIRCIGTNFLTVHVKLKEKNSSYINNWHPNIYIAQLIFYGNTNVQKCNFAYRYEIEHVIKQKNL